TRPSSSGARRRGYGCGTCGSTLRRGSTTAASPAAGRTSSRASSTGSGCRTASGRRIGPTVAGISGCSFRPRLNSQSARSALRLGLVEELLPAGKERLQLVTRGPMCRQCVGVGPVLGQPLLEVGNRLLPRGDLGFELLELAGLARLGRLGAPL